MYFVCENINPFQIFAPPTECRFTPVMICSVDVNRYFFDTDLAETVIRGQKSRQGCVRVNRE